jgi:autotransporter-associated beta strand protein
MFSTWWRQLMSRKLRASRRERRTGARRTPSRRLQCEPLEDRVLLATRFWDGIADSGIPTLNANWSNRFNWAGDVAPVVGDDLVFPPVAQRKTGQINDFPINRLFDSITYTGSGYSVLSSNPITLGAGGFNASHASGSNTFGPGINLGILNFRTFTVTNAGAEMVLNGPISGTLSGPRKRGSGTLVLGAANSYDERTFVDQGVVRVRSNAGLGSTFTGTTVAAGAAVEFEGILTVAESFILNGTGVGGSGALRSVQGGTTLTGAIALTSTSAIGADAGTLNVNGVISGPSAAGLQKVGDGTVELGGANTYAGATTVSAGILGLTKDSGLGSVGGGVTVQEGAELRLSFGITVSENLLNLSGRLSGFFGPNTWAGAVNALGANASVSAIFAPIGGSSLILSGIIGGTAGSVLTTTGDPILTSVVFSGTSGNVFPGTVRIKQGLLVLNKSSGNAIAGALVVGDGAGTDAVRLQRANQIADTSPVTINSSGVLNLNGFSDTIGPLTMTGGRVTTGAGLLRLNGNVTATSASAGNSARLEGNLQLNAERTFTVNDGPAESDLLVSAVVSSFGNSDLIKNGVGRMELSNANSYSGVTTVNAGFLRASNAQALGRPGSAVNTVVNSGGTLEVIGPFTLDENLTLNGAGADGAGALVVQGGSATQATTFTRPIDVNGRIRTDGNAVFNGVVSGSGFSKLGLATLALNAANTYDAQTVVVAGTLRAGNAQALGTTSAGTEVRPGATLEANFNGTSGEPLFLNGAGSAGSLGALVAGGGAVFTAPVTLETNSTVGAIFDPINQLGGSLNLAGRINSGPFGGNELTISSGFVTLSGTGSNTHGTTRVSGGQLILNKSANTDAVPGALIVSDATSGNFPPSVVVQSPGQIADNAPVTIDGTGFFQVGGVLIVSADEAIGPLTLNSGGVTGAGTLTLNNNVTSSGNSVLESNVSLGSTPRAFTVTSTLNTAFSSTWSGGAGAGLIKAGPGTLNLDGTNLFTVPTTVAAGTLFVRNALPGPVTVNSGATLTGNDSRSFAGPGGPLADITVTGGTLNPGNDRLATPFGGPLSGNPPSPAGILRSSGNVAFQSGSTFHVDIGGTTAGPTGHDQLNISSNGTIDLGNARLDVAFVGNFQSQVGNTYTIVQNDTANPISGFFTDGAGNVIPQGGEVLVNGVRLRVNYSGGNFNDVVLTHENTSPTFVNRSVTSPLTEGQTATLTGTIVDPDPLDTFFLDVDWGDGIVRTFAFGPGANGTTVNITHTYEDEDDDDTYVIHLVWRDEHAISNSADLEVTVHNVDPVVDAGGLALVRNHQQFTRRGFFTDPGLLDTHTATVDYGDGAGPEPLDLRRDGSFRLRHRYTRPGVYRVTVAVTDDDGGVGRDRFRVVVLPSGRGALVQQLVDLFFALAGGSDDDPFDGGR